jgi:hypothetical protein
MVTDLGSRNGTYLNGRRVGVSEHTPEVVREGDEIAFSERDETWVLIDAAAPQPLLVPDDGSSPLRLSEAELLAWPTESETRAYLYCEAHLWKFEDAAGTVRELRAGAELRLGSVTFRLHLPGPAPETPPALVPVTERTLFDVSLEIVVSADEETAAISAELSGERFVLPPRAHLYLLAHLARRRLAERTRGEGDDGGWIAVEDVCRELAIASAEALTVTVYRCRKDFERLGFHEASRLVDRARRGFLRIGIVAERLRVAQG